MDRIGYFIQAVVGLGLLMGAAYFAVIIGYTWSEAPANYLAAKVAMQAFNACAFVLGVILFIVGVGRAAGID